MALRYSRHSFRIGLPVILFFAVVCWLGVRHAAYQIYTERAVYRQGVPITGAVEEKILYRQAEVWEQAHYVAYRFDPPDHPPVRKRIRVEPSAWHLLKDNGPIAIRYVPARPELNLPEGWHMAGFFFMVGGITCVGALFFTVILLGMLVKKFTGG